MNIVRQALHGLTRVISRNTQRQHFGHGCCRYSDCNSSDLAVIRSIAAQLDAYESVLSLTQANLTVSVLESDDVRHAIHPSC